MTLAIPLALLALRPSKQTIEFRPAIHFCRIDGQVRGEQCQALDLHGLDREDDTKELRKGKYEVSRSV